MRTHAPAALAARRASSCGRCACRARARRRRSPPAIADLNRARRRRRADRRARRRLARGPLGVQRGGRGARDRRARASRSCPRVGHEIDFTIADFVADVRAPTPTRPPRRSWCPTAARSTQRLGRSAAALRGALARRVAACGERVRVLERRLGEPRRRVADAALRLDELAHRARRGLARRVAWDRASSRRSRPASRGAARCRPRRRTGERLAAVPERLRFALGVRVRHERVGGRARAAAARGALAARVPRARLRDRAPRRRGRPGRARRGGARAGDTVALVLARGRAPGAEHRRSGETLMRGSRADAKRGRALRGGARASSRASSSASRRESCRLERSWRLERTSPRGVAGRLRAGVRCCAAARAARPTSSSGSRCCCEIRGRQAASSRPAADDEE